MKLNTRGSGTYPFIVALSMLMSDSGCGYVLSIAYRFGTHLSGFEKNPTSQLSELQGKVAWGFQAKGFLNPPTPITLLLGTAQHLTARKQN